MTKLLRWVPMPILWASATYAMSSYHGWAWYWVYVGFVFMVYVQYLLYMLIVGLKFAYRLGYESAQPT